MKHTDMKPFDVVDIWGMQHENADFSTIQIQTPFQPTEPLCVCKLWYKIISSGLDSGEVENTGWRWSSCVAVVWNSLLQAPRQDEHRINSWIKFLRPTKSSLGTRYMLRCEPRSSGWMRWMMKGWELGMALTERREWEGINALTKKLRHSGAVIN